MIEIVYPLIIGLLIDQVFYNHNYVSLFGYTSLFGCLFIIQQIFVYIESKCGIFIHNTCLHNIRVYLFDRVLRANAKINISKENGEIINIIDNDCEQIFNFLVNILFGTITQFIQMFILIFILFKYNYIIKRINIKDQQEKNLIYIFCIFLTIIYDKFLEHSGFRHAYRYFITADGSVL